MEDGDEEGRGHQLPGGTHPGNSLRVTHLRSRTQSSGIGGHIRCHGLPSELITRHHWRKGANYVAFLLGLLLVGRIWFAGIQSLATFLGLVTAGLAIALQDLVQILREFAAREGIDFAYPTQRFYDNVTEGKPQARARPASPP